MTMRISVILAHPDTKSLNHAIAGTAAGRLEENGYAVSLHDLYGEGFDPMLPRRGDRQRTLCCPSWWKPFAEKSGRPTALWVVHPNWWGQPPGDTEGLDRPGDSSPASPMNSSRGIPAKACRGASSERKPP